MLFVIGGVILFFTLLSMEAMLRKMTKQNEEIIQLLRDIKERE
ncbi:hypothetical protein [Ornithinibacillus caprae]|nr:hypothetical protein [Ornithinibacillus caprae]